MKNRIVAFVPMRHESERVPGKNFRPFDGRPLYHYIISTLLECPMISEILIDTDSPFILEDAGKNFPAVRLVERPEHLRGGEVPTNDILLHDVTFIEADYYLQTHSTNPLLRTETVTEAINTFLNKLPEYDSLFSVTRVQSRFWDERGRPINHDPAVLLRTQNLAPIYEENSCIYIFGRKVLEARRNRIGERPFLFEIAREEAWDIDEEVDFLLTEFLHKQRMERE
jgi:CMP-N-acetylneuraminic acid synthetase